MNMNKSFDINSFEERLNIKNQFDGNLKHGAAKFHSQTNRSGKGKPADGGLIREHAKVVFDTGVDRYQRIKGFWEEVNNCPVCKSCERDPFLSRLGLEVWRCRNCDHRYLNPRINYKKVCEIYSDDKTASDMYLQPLQKEIDRDKYRYGLSLIDQIGTPSRKLIMDLGCGAGVFLEEASSLGWTSCIGVDANERYSLSYKNVPGIQYIQTTFESLDMNKLGSNYDCISMWNVLEHIYDLNTIVSVIKKLLKINGLFFIMVPNVESLASRLIREKSATFNWKHVSHFCKSSLEKLMDQHQFECVHLETAITEIDNIKSYLSGEYPYHGYGDPEGLFDFITPEYIHKNLLGSRLIGVFKNVK